MKYITRKCKFILLAIIVLTTAGCKAIYIRTNDINKEVSFTSKEAYTTYFNLNYEITQDKIYFPQPGAYWEVASYLLKDVDYFYGITLNDSTQIDDPYLNEIKSCSGRVSGIIHALDKDYNTKPTQLSKFNLTNSSGQKMDISKGKSVIFILSTKLGRERLKTIKELSAEVEALNNPDVNYYLIAVDEPASYGVK